MKPLQSKTHYFFVDESGDTTFYDRYGTLIVGNPGCSKLLILGFILTTDPHSIRQKIVLLQKEIAKDKYLQKIPSLEKSLRAFHAKDDCPEVREKMFRLIETLDFKAEFVVARKIDGLFCKKHHSNPGILYDDLIVHLFKNKLHLATENIIYFAKRGDKDKQAPLAHIIQKTVAGFEKKHSHKNVAIHKIYSQLPKTEPCLQVIDYVTWAVQRAFIKKESRYMDFLQNKIRFICDIYDFEKYPDNFSSKDNPFDITKISPL